MVYIYCLITEFEHVVSPADYYAVAVTELGVHGKQRGEGDVR